jgi:oxalate decarboxylase/phosphoglucose isomerase-like protein (cupin superfamily)
VDAADLRDFVEFSEGDVLRKTVFESERLWSQVVTLDRNQHYGPVSDPAADAMLTILAGEAVFMVNRSRKRMKQWGSVVVPTGSELVVTNASPEPLVILMVTAPPPAPRDVSG